jgi:hypothetical protein
MRIDRNGLKQDSDGSLYKLIEYRDENRRIVQRQLVAPAPLKPATVSKEVVRTWVRWPGNWDEPFPMPQAKPRMQEVKRG